LKVEVLDGDEARKKLSRELGFSKADRDTHIRRLGYLAALLTRNGVAVIVAAISPYRETRNLNRQEIGNYVEVYCRCSLSVAESRDVKGMYEKARRGEMKSFTGVNDPYEEPLNPEVLLNTDVETISESLEKIWSTLRDLGYLL
jgi:adenylyl-sulfate kinase